MKSSLKLKDADMRDIVFGLYEDSSSKLRIFEEFCIGKTRTDALLVMEDELIGIEFKSDKDNLDRLERQIKDYNRFCDRNYIVIGQHFREKSEALYEILPDYWGIYSVTMDEDGTKSLELVREATANKKCRLKNQLKILWRSELIHLVKSNNLGGVTAYNKKELSDKLFKNIEKDNLRQMICQELLERDYSIYEEKENGNEA